MPWFPVDDAFHSHPKARKAGDEAVGMWVRAGAYCMAYLTDGFVPEWWVKEQSRGISKAKRLVVAALWRPGDKDGEQGWWFHGWKPECTKAYVLKKREEARQRKAKSRESHGESRVTEHVTDAVSPASCLVPTQSIPISIGEGAASAPPPRCSKHVNDPDPPNCWACKRKREAAEAEAAIQDLLAAQDRADWAALRQQCQLCDEAGWVLGSDPVVKCDHHVEEVAR